MHVEAAANGVLQWLAKSGPNSFLSRLYALKFRRQEVIYDAGAPLTHVLFPVRGSLAINVVTKNREMELGVVDHSGCYGYFGCDAVTQSPYKVIVESEGTGFGIDRDALREELQRDPTSVRRFEVERALLLAVASQAAACSGLHQMEQRICRRLLEAVDRSGSTELVSTHDYLARALGVRRPTVSEILGSIEERNLISQSRGRMRILDFAAMERLSCACYAALKEQRRRLVDGCEATGIQSAAAQP